MKGDLSMKKLDAELPNLSEQELRSALSAMCCILARDIGAWRAFNDQFRSFKVGEIHEDFQPRVQDGMTVLRQCVHE